MYLSVLISLEMVENTLGKAGISQYLAVATVLFDQYTREMTMKSDSFGVCHQCIILFNFSYVFYFILNCLRNRRRYFLWQRLKDCSHFLKQVFMTKNQGILLLFVCIFQFM